MIDMVTTHLCTECNEYYEAYEMASIEEHLCSECANSIETGRIIAELNDTIDSLRAELEAARADSTWQVVTGAVFTPTIEGIPANYPLEFTVSDDGQFITFGIDDMEYEMDLQDKRLMRPAPMPPAMEAGNE